MRSHSVKSVETIKEKVPCREACSNTTAAQSLSGRQTQVCSWQTLGHWSFIARSLVTGRSPLKTSLGFFFLSYSSLSLSYSFLSIHFCSPFRLSSFLSHLQFLLFPTSVRRGSSPVPWCCLSREAASVITTEVDNTNEPLFTRFFPRTRRISFSSSPRP